MSASSSLKPKRVSVSKSIKDEAPKSLSEFFENETPLNLDFLAPPAPTAISQAPVPRSTKSPPLRKPISRSKTVKPDSNFSERFTSALLPETPFNYTALLKILPSPDWSSEEIVNPAGHAERWHLRFAQYLRILLLPFYKDFETLQLITSDPYIRIFRRAFTDVSFSADDNETMETLGDKILGTAFVHEVRARQPNVTPNKLTNFVTNYMAKTFQAKLATEMKMQEWVLLGSASAKLRTDVSTPSFREDVFEAFASALEQAGNAVHQFYISQERYRDAILLAPPGFQMVRKFLSFIFDSVGLDPKMGENSARTTLGEIGTIFGIRDRGIKFDFPPAGTINPRFVVRTHPDLINVLSEQGISNFPKLLAEAGDATTASDLALARAGEFGVTPEWILARREISQGVALLPASLRDSVVEKARREGITKIFFEIPERTKQSDGNFTLVMMGATANDQRVTLADAVGSSARVLRVEAANAYLRH